MFDRPTAIKLTAQLQACINILEIIHPVAGSSGRWSKSANKNAQELLAKRFDEATATFHTLNNDILPQ